MLELERNKHSWLRFLYRECFVPTLGMNGSLAGNVLFPRWEYLVPSMGITAGMMDFEKKGKEKSLIICSSQFFLLTLQNIQ